MTEQNNNPQSINDILKSLDSLSSGFNLSAERKAAPDKQVAQILESAAQALRTEQQKNRELQHQLYALQNASTLKRLKGKDFTFLIDGSGSMEFGTDKPKVSLGDILNFSKITESNTTAAFWGDEKVRPIPLKGWDIKYLEKNAAPSCGTNFAPAVDYMQSLAASTKKKQHFIILSDGDFFDKDEARPKACNLLKTCPKATIDFVVISSRYDTVMDGFASMLRCQFPEQVGFKLIAPGKPLDEALVNIAVQRIQSPAKPKTPKPKP